jgi:CRISPR-associated DxTHG motif protein
VAKRGYERTIYRFPNNQEYETSLFLEAVLKTTMWPIKKVILIGTRTTSWDALIPNRESDENVDFWQKILDECEDRERGVGDESIKELEAKLPSWYDNTKFKIMPPHTDQISFANVEDVFSIYKEIPNELEPDTDVLFDITHGFRSMPLLIFQSLQLNSSKINDRNVLMIYGELSSTTAEGKRISEVRDLSKYWDYYEISAARKLFESKFDGKILAEKIKPFWEDGEKCIVRFCTIVECNFSLQLSEALRQIKNAVEKYDPAGNPQWVTDVWNDLRVIHERLIRGKQSIMPEAAILRRYADILEEKGLITQAVIALQVTTETAIAEKYDREHIGDYQWYHGYGKDDGTGQGYLRAIRRQDQKMSIALGKLEALRNQIAHGGGKDRNGDPPQIANLTRILKRGKAAVDKLFQVLEDT